MYNSIYNYIFIIISLYIYYNYIIYYVYIYIIHSRGTMIKRYPYPSVVQTCFAWRLKSCGQSFPAQSHTSVAMT